MTTTVWQQLNSHRLATSLGGAEIDNNGADARGTSVDAHVVLVTNFIPPHLSPMLRELSQRVRKLTILVSTPMESNRSWEPAWDGLDVVVQRTTTWSLPWRHPSGFSDTVHVHVPWDTIRQLRQLQPDILISDEFGLRTLFAAFYQWRRPRLPFLIGVGMTDHTEKGRGWLRYVLRRWLVKQADFFAVTGEGGRRYLRTLKVASEQVFVVPYSAEPKALYHGPVQRTDEEARRLLFVGQVIERKGIVPFVQALIRHAQRHPDRPIEFVVVGGGPQLDMLKAMQLPDNLTMPLLGPCKFEEVLTQYQRSGIFVMPTLADEWGLVVNEAMTAGLPVLGCVYGQAVEQLCEHGKTGWLFRTDHEEEIEQAIEDALDTTPDRLATMRDAARAAALPLTPAHAADCFVRLLRKAWECH